MSLNPKTATRRRFILRLQESGLLLVIFALGTVLTFLGGTVRLPKMRVNAQGDPERVFTVNRSGEPELVMEEKNKFLNLDNLTKLAKDTSFFAIMAVGATFVIISGGIDLSVGSIYALASVLAALTLHVFGPDGAHSNMVQWKSVPLGIAVCLGSATLCGLLNGSMIVALRVHPFIITLGTMAIYRGVAFLMTEGQSVGGFPPAFSGLVKWEAFNGLRLAPMIVMLFVTVVGAISLSRLAAGRRIYAVGGNELASRFSGIQVPVVKLSVYVISGLTAGISAMLAIGYYGSATSGDGQGYELDVIASAVVGGASLAGGKGTALGALLGALIIKMIDNGIIILGINQNYSRIIIGVAVILAVLLDQVNAWLARRRLLAANI